MTQKNSFAFRINDQDGRKGFDFEFGLQNSVFADLAWGEVLAAGKVELEGNYVSDRGLSKLGFRE